MWVVAALADELSVLPEHLLASPASTPLVDAQVRSGVRAPTVEAMSAKTEVPGDQVAAVIDIIDAELRFLATLLEERGTSREPHWAGEGGSDGGSTAKAIRERMGLGTDDSVSDLFQLIESLDVSVVAAAAPGGPAVISFSFTDGQPAIFVNTALGPLKVRFGAAHGLAHHSLGHLAPGQAIDHLSANPSRPPPLASEIEAHRFAAHLLVPRRFALSNREEAESLLGVEPEVVDLVERPSTVGRDSFGAQTKTWQMPKPHLPHRLNKLYSQAVERDLIPETRVLTVKRILQSVGL
jgi:Zn-dependent peptidase ImmA (M78 family)